MQAILEVKLDKDCLVHLAGSNINKNSLAKFKLSLYDFFCKTNQGDIMHTLD